MTNDIQFKIAIGLLRYFGFLIAITMYQAGLAIMAKNRGDKSLETQYRATLNPIPHIDLLGTIICPLITILLNFPIVLGWPKAHNIDTRYFKNMKKDINLVYISGVGVNFIISILCMIVLKLSGGGIFIINPALDFSNTDILWRVMVALTGLTNITIGALLVLPIPGMAGWNLLMNNISYNAAQKLQKNLLMISLIGLGLIVAGLLNFYFEIFIKIFMYASSTIIGF